MVEPSAWTRTIQADPQHSHRYANRWRSLEAAGHDLYGEARTVDAMVGREARILDAGCGTGRVGGYLRRLGHSVVGVDVDPTLIDYAKTDHPDGVWIAGDLAELDLPAAGIPDPFDAIVSAGNVMGFLAASTRVDVLTRLRRHLAPGGRLVVGFGAGRGYAFDEYFNDLTEAGLVLEVALSSWDLRPFTADSNFLVSISSAEN